MSVYALLEELSDAAWVVECGRPVNEPALVKATMTEALRVVSDRHEENVLMEEVNLMCEQIVRTALAEWRKWNDTVERFRPVINELVDRKLSQDDVGVKVPKRMVVHVRGIVLCAVMEEHYRAHHTRGFHRQMARWLTKGHIPLSWEGNWPSGSPILF